MSKTQGTGYVRISLLIIFIACCAGPSGACGPAVPPLANSAGSPEELANAALDALAREDVAGLRALGLNEREFRDHVWPDLPAARPERNLPFSYVWGDLHQKSEAALSMTVRAHGGRRYTLERVEFLDGTTQYRSYVVRRRSVLTVRDASGAEQRLQLFGSVLLKAGRFKIFSFVVD